MGPERIFPNQNDELGDPQDPPVAFSGGEEEEEDEDGVQSGYQYQPLNQEPEEGAQTEGDLQERLQAMRLHLPDPPPDSEDEEESETASSSIPMDPEHVELVKNTMAAVKLPSLSVPLWAQQISDADWQKLVNQTIQSRAAAPVHSKK
ncbi:male-enhanced antigen 1 [Spea bombifrons]|uniref:male-enhanced antigen 1 n=1 Tax=Spea bombifrons TaxID=233779 RepID=UPI0023491FE3|nr:male-enhanced antigen 1 [Spea bombifrons]